MPRLSTPCETQVTSADAAARYVQARLGQGGRAWAAQELAEGRINYVFRVWERSGGGEGEAPAQTVLLKYCPPYVRSLGEGAFPLTQDRLRVEASALQLSHASSPKHTPRLLLYDPLGHVMVQEFLPSHVELSEAIHTLQLQLPGMAEQLADFMSRSMYLSSTYCSTAEAWAQLAQQFANPDIVEANELVVLTGPFDPGCAANRFPAELAAAVEELRLDPEVQQAHAHLLHTYRTRREALIHHDLHPGNILVGVRPCTPPGQLARGTSGMQEGMAAAGTVAPPGCAAAALQLKTHVAAAGLASGVVEPLSGLMAASVASVAVESPSWYREGSLCGGAVQQAQPGSCDAAEGRSGGAASSMCGSGAAGTPTPAALRDGGQPEAAAAEAWDVPKGSLAPTGSLYVMDYEFATVGPMAYDVGSLIGNLLLAALTLRAGAADVAAEREPSGPGPSCSGARQQGRCADADADAASIRAREQAAWVLGSIEVLWASFSRKLLHLASSRQRGEGPPGSGGAAPALLLGGDLPLEPLWRDSLGFAALCVVRLNIGMHHYPALDRLPSAGARARCSRQALALARAMLQSLAPGRQPMSVHQLVLRVCEQE